jgi:excisionase family DNA binding protein
MAGMFYSLKEAAEKLNKTEEEVQEIVKQGRLREFRDGPNLLFKVDEVEALMSDTGIIGLQEPSAAPEEQQVDVDEILLAPEFSEAAPEDKGGLTDADTTVASGGTDVLGETGAAGKTAEGADVSKAEAGPDETFLVSSDETSVDSSAKESLEQIEEDVSLDSFGSGSGLLDLSLQADDTSLGGILDEIYAPEGEEQAQPAEAASAMDLTAETEQMLSDQTFDTSQPTVVQTPEAAAYLEPRSDALSDAFGLMLFLPLLLVFYTAVVAVAGFSDMTPAILEKVQSIIWYVLIGLAVAAGLVVGAAFMLTAGVGKATAKPKAKKQKEPKVKKEKKPKKEKEPKA